MPKIELQGRDGRQRTATAVLPSLKDIALSIAFVCCKPVR